MTPTIVYAPIPDDWRYHRMDVIKIAMHMAAAGGLPISLCVGGKTVIVHPSHLEQLRVELNAILPECERQ